jgi:hypothetical protein
MLTERELLEKVNAPVSRVAQGALMALCIGGGAVGIPVLLLQGRPPDASWFCAVPFLGFGGWLLGTLLWLGTTRMFGRYRHQLELLRRAGWIGFSERLDRARADVDAGRAEWIILLRGRSLPHGAEHHVRLDAPSGRLESFEQRFSALDLEAGDPREKLSVTARTVPSLEPYAQLLADDLSGEPLQPVRDGFPFTLHVLRRGKSFTVEGNLSAGCVDRRTEQLVKALLGLHSAQ